MRRRRPRPRRKRPGYQEGGEVDELYNYQGETPAPEDIRPAPGTPQQDITYDDRWLQAQENIEGAMERLGAEPDPDLPASRGVREHENWSYTEEGQEDPILGRRAQLTPRTRSYQRGGPVKKQRRQTLRGNTESTAMRKWTGAPATGYGMPKYAAGGEVGYGVSGPVMMASALRSRSSDPDHAVEDAGPLATMPEGAPSVPEEQGYRRGGPVRRTGYQEGGDVEDDEPDIPAPDEEEQPSPARQPVAAEPDAAEPDAAEPDAEEAASQLVETGGEEGGDEGGGGPSQQQQAPAEEGGDEEGGAAPTGYNAPPKDQADRDPQALQAQEEAAQEPTGFRPRQAAQDDPEQQLKDVLDYTRKQFGLDKGQHPQAQPQQQQAQAEPERGPAAPRAAPGIAPAAGTALPPPPAQAPDATAPEEGAPQPVPQAPAPGAAPMPMPQPRPQGAPTQPQAVSGVQGPAAPAGAPQQLTDYLKGERNFTPEQMTGLLDRATQENPHLDQSGSIRKAFQDLVGKGDMDGASRFIQALRPSYDNLRSAMVAATAQGKYVEALQIAERLNNLIPNGNQVSFHPTENGLITAVVRPESGEAARTYHLTPQQFHQYANGSGSIFDIAADRGIDATLKTAAQGPQTPPSPENAPPYRVAGPSMPPPTGQAPAVGAIGRPPISNDPTALRAQAAAIAAGLPGQAPTTTSTPVSAPTGIRTAAPAAAPAAAPVAAPAAAAPVAAPAAVPAASATAALGGDQQQRNMEAAAANAAAANQRLGFGTRAPAVPTVQAAPVVPPTNGAQPLATGYRPTTAGRVQPMAPGGQQPREGETRNFPARSEVPTGGRYPPTGGTLPTAPPYSARYNWDTGKWEPVGQARYNQRSGQWEPTTGYQNSPARQQPPTTGQGQQPPTTGQGQQPQQRPTAQPQTTGQGQQPQTTGQGQRQPGQYTGTPEQKQQQYQQDLKDWTLRDRARQAYPNLGDEGKRKRYEDTLKAREGTQQRFEQRQTLDQQKLDETNRRHRETQDGLNNRALMGRLNGLGMQAERLAFQELENRVKAWEAKPENKIGNKEYPYEDRDKQLLRKLRETAIENDMWQQQRPQLKPNPNSPPIKPTEPAVRESPRLAPAPTPGGSGGGGGNGKVDLEKYRGDTEPHAAPQGKEWRRSKVSGKWQLFDAEPARPARPTVPMSQ